MDHSFPITILTLLLLVQGVGGLCVALTLGTLYVYRRRPALLYWTFAWLCNGLWLLLGSLNYRLLREGANLRLGGELWLQHVAVLCGWWQAAWWLLSTRYLRRQASRPGGDVLAAPPPLLPLSHWAVLLGSAALAVGLSRGLDLPARNVLLGGVQALVFLWGAAVLARHWEGVRRVTVYLLACALALYGFDRLHYAAMYLWAQRGGDPVGTYAGFAAIVDFLAQALLGVAMLVFLLDAEQGELKEAVRRLEESEERFRLIFENSGVGMALLAPDGRTLQVNPALSRMLGYSDEELRGRRLDDMIYKQDRTIHNLKRLGPGDEVPLYEREKRYLRKDGQSIWARVVRVPVRDAGKVRHYVGVLVDITERKRAEDALAASEKRYRLLNQVAGDGIHVTGEDGEFLDVNPAFCQMLGYAREELLRLTLERVAEEPEAVGEHRARVVRQGRDRLETRLRRKDGGRVEVEMNGAVLDLEGRRLFHGICRDVTEQRRLEERLRQARQMETLGTLVGGIAHDFNNKLTAVLGNLDLVLKDPRFGEGLPGPAKASLSDAERAAQYCADITRRLLTFSRGQIGVTETVSVGALLAEVGQTLRREFPSSIVVQVEAVPGVRPVTADVSQVRQVLLGLAANAHDAMPEGGALTLTAEDREFGEEARAAHAEARPGKFVEVAIRDTGAGMAPEVQARLFEPFFTTKAPGQAAGMSLAMAYGIVKAHGGWITVESAPDAGSTFRVYLPAGEAKVAAVRLTAPPAEEEAAGGACVLIVDDEDLVRNLAEAVLQREGYRVLTAADGEEALAIFRRQASAIDLVLLDYSMPRMTGLQAFEQMLLVNPDVRAVFASGYTMDSDSDQLLAAGGKAFLPKPFRPGDLIRTVRAVLAGRPPSLPEATTAHQ